MLKNKMASIFSAILVSILVLLSPNILPTSGFILGDADPLLNNIWIEPNNPKRGDVVSIHSEIYNIGSESTMSVTDTVTIGYLINGELVKIDQLVDVKPGLENGIHITSGPIWNAWDGEYIITVILDYHDTLSHITDDSQNNIMQKVFRIGDQIEKNLVSFDIYQEFKHDAKQEIQIKGKIVLPPNLPIFPKPQMHIVIDDSQYTAFVDRENGEFYFREIIPTYDEIIPITISFDNERFEKSDYTHTHNLYPIALSKDKSGLVLKIQNPSEKHNFEDGDFDIVIYNDDFKKVMSNADLNSGTIIAPDIFAIELDNDRYNVEVYFENLLYATAFQLEKNLVSEKIIPIPELGKVRFNIVDPNEFPIKNSQVIIPGTHPEITNDEGFTDWIKVLPTTNIKSPYAGRVTTDYEKTIWSESFFISSGEEKTIRVVIK